MTLLFRLCLLLAVGFVTLPQGARAHFSYSDPRIIHVTDAAGDVYILMRLPAPLALLPGDWQGQAETRLPPFALDERGKAMLDGSALNASKGAFAAALRGAVEVEVNGLRVRPEVRAFRIHPDDTRPRFGTVRTALAAFDDRATSAPVGYFDATLDVMLVLPGAELSDDLRLRSRLGENFQVIEKFGTVVKLHRAEGTETRAGIGLLDVRFPAIITRWQSLRDAAWSGAEHIYRGADHLALILLIAVAASGWRQALGWASAFTFGHVITLTAGLYGIAPSAGWFIPLVELSIAVSIVVAGVAVVARRGFGWVGLLLIGLVHGYGFAASASTVLFAGEVDSLMLLAFATGLELCQLAIYALVLPLILLADRILPALTWRRALALGIALIAVSATLTRLTEATGSFAA